MVVIGETKIKYLQVQKATHYKALLLHFVASKIIKIVLH